MAHQCVHCSKTYGDGAEEVLKGCSCGGRFFFYISEEKLKRIQENKESEEVQLSVGEKKQIEKDVRDIVGVDENEETPIVLDFESIKILKPGKYIIDVRNLFTKERPLIYKLEEGKYFIDLTSQINK